MEINASEFKIQSTSNVLTETGEFFDTFYSADSEQIVHILKTAEGAEKLLDEDFKWSFWNKKNGDEDVEACLIRDIKANNK